MHVLGWSFLPCLWSPICNNFWNYILFEWHFVNVKKSLCQCWELISLMHIWERDELLFVVNGRLRHATVPKIKRNSFCVECWQTDFFLWINMLMILLGTLHNKVAGRLRMAEWQRNVAQDQSRATFFVILLSQVFQLSCCLRSLLSATQQVSCVISQILMNSLRQ